VVPAVASAAVDETTVDQHPAQPHVAGEHVAGEQAQQRQDARRTLWHTAWGVVLAASAAFSLGYGASRSADPSVGASRPPAWPLFISVLVVAVSIWFVLAPRMHRWPFEDRPGDATGSQPWLTELTETDDPDAAPLAPMHVDTSVETSPPPDPSSSPHP
jgi:hypothetical protein